MYLFPEWTKKGLYKIVGTLEYSLVKGEMDKKRKGMCVLL
jgi:hypothetical protein